MIEQICEKCGKAIDGYAATVHTVENWKSGHTNTWCEKCCEDHGMCKCDGCSEEFAEEFHMPRIDGGLFCIPCAREKMPECFDECSVFKTGDDCRQHETLSPCRYQVRMRLAGTGTVFYLTKTFETTEETYEYIREDAYEIAELINDYDSFPATYLGPAEDESDEYDESNGQLDFNFDTFMDWITKLIQDHSFSNKVMEAEIITRCLSKDAILSEYFQAEILDSYDESVICTTSSYTEKEIVYEELRGEIDKIGQVIAEEVDDCKYLGDVDYAEGEEFNDHHERWDFNKKTLSEWIETAIDNGNYDGPLVDIRIETNEIRDRYIPIDVDVVETN